MSSVVIEDQSPIMHRAKIRLGIAIALLIIALVSLALSEKSKKTILLPNKAPPQTASVAKPATPPPPKIELMQEPEKALLPSKTPTYEPLISYQSFTAEPETKPQSETIASTPIQKPVEFVPVKKETKNQIETSTTGSFILQVGVFSDIKNAEKQRESLAKKNIESHFKGTLHIGPFADASGLESAREKLKASGSGINLTEESSARGLMLRTGVFSELANLRNLETTIKELGMQTRTETRVLVGPFANKTSADNARNKIKNLNFSVVLMSNS